MKKIISFAVAGIFTLGMGAGLASAATISNAVFSNGDTTIDATGGSTVNGTFILQVGANETCEVLRTQADTQPFTDTAVGGPLGDQQGTYTNVPFSVKVPPNTGTYNVTVQCAGIWGGNHSIDGADNVVVGPVSIGTVRVVANTTSSGSPTFGGMDLTSLIALLKSLGFNVSSGTGTPATPAKPACSPLLAQAMPGATTAVNGQLQGFLIGEGFAIPALMSAHPAPFGFYGTQTAAAVTAYRATCQ